MVMLYAIVFIVRCLKGNRKLLKYNRLIFKSCSYCTNKLNYNFEVEIYLLNSLCYEDTTSSAAGWPARISGAARCRTTSFDRDQWRTLGAEAQVLKTTN